MAKGRMRSRTQEMKAYMKKKRVTKPLKKRSLKYLEQYYDNIHGRTALNAEHILSELPLALREEVLLFVHRDAIQKMPSLNQGGQNFLTYILKVMRPVFVMTGDKAVIRGQVATKVMFIIEGKLAVRKKQDTQEKKRKAGFLKSLQLKLVCEGEFFGEACIRYSTLEPKIYKTSLHALTNCHLLSIDGSYVKNIMQHYYPAFATALIKALVPKETKMKNSMMDVVQEKLRVAKAEEAKKPLAIEPVAVSAEENNMKVISSLSLAETESEESLGVTCEVPSDPTKLETNIVYVATAQN